MTTRGWRPKSHLSRDFGVAFSVVAIAFGIQHLPENEFLSTNPTGISREMILMSVGAISGTITGTSIIAMTIVVGWWKVGRLGTVTSIPAYGNTMLLVLKTTTWILGFLAVLLVCLAVLPLSSKVEALVTPFYAAVAATAVNYFRRTITMLYGAAALVTKMVDD